jgi:hypothetical protein
MHVGTYSMHFERGANFGRDAVGVTCCHKIGIASSQLRAAQL